jgi:sodium transport system ATP-binding protein
LGANGAGKTTLLRVLSTSLQPTRGTALVGGVDIVKDPLQVRRKIGFLSGKTGLYARLTPQETLAFFGRMHGFSKSDIKQRIKALFDELDIHSYADKQCDLLSTGMRQKVSIARSLVHDPEIIIFDEPTTGLDVAASQTILEVIDRCRQQQKSVIFSTHHMHEVEKLCDWVVIIEQGAMCFEGSVADMRSASGKQLLDEAYLALANKPNNAAQEVAYA